MKALAEALVAAQAEMGAAVKDSQNPHFKSSFASLKAVRDACVPILNKHGIAVLQPPASEDGLTVTVNTTLLHTSGETLTSALTVKPVKSDPQGIGSAITYARRYGLAGMVGLAFADEDDDGEASAGRAPQAAAMPEGFEAWAKALSECPDTATLQARWTTSSVERRRYMTQHHADVWARIKASVAAKGAA